MAVPGPPDHHRDTLGPLRRPDRETMDTPEYVIFAIAILTVGWLAFTEACKKK